MEEDLKIKTLNEAIDIIVEGISYIRDDSYTNQKDDLQGLLIKIISNIDKKRAEKFAEELLIKDKNGNGYYLLARIEYRKNTDNIKSSNLLDKALGAKKCPPGAIALKIKILLENTKPDYRLLLKLTERLSADPTYNDTWESAYHKGIVYFINEKYKKSDHYFYRANKISPFTFRRDVQIFWRENGKKRIFNGKISPNFEDEKGYIYSHGVPGFKEEIYFNPLPNRYSSKKLKSGIEVEFYLGFSPRGPQAIDVRPKRLYS